jgi:hypothetical protein
MRFGTVVGIDYEPELRMMALRSVLGENGTLRDIWQAVVIADEARSDAWTVGRLVTFPADASGLVVYEEGE